MDCRQFRKQHAYFLDDMLSGVETWAMREHVTSCASCSRFDTQLRRSLLIARQAPTLEPSRGFQRKLSARLAAEKLARHPFHEMTPQPRTRRLPLMAAAAAALAVGMAGLGIFATPAGQPVAAVAQTATPTPTTTDLSREELFPVSAPADQPVHPAMRLAQRATEQFAASQVRAASMRATH
jgi:hypothetical protein